MNVQARRARALALLEQTGMLRSSYAPPLFRVLWRLGVHAPPPHFMGFWTLATVYAWGRRKYRLPTWEALGAD